MTRVLSNDGGTRPRVGINLMWCRPGKVGGSEEYTVRQLLGLARDEFDAVVYASSQFLEAHAEIATRFRTVVSPATSNRVRRVVAESRWLRQASIGDAVVHHGGGTAPWRARRPYTLTIHDLQFMDYPQYFSRTKRRYLAAALPRSVRAAAAVGVPTEFVKSTVADRLAVPSERIYVIPHGLSTAVLGPATPPDELRRRFGLGVGRLLVYPAVTHPHKNHRFLLQLLADHWRDDDVQLVFIGGSGFAEAEVSGIDDRRVLRLGRVGPEDRNGLLQMAEAMVFPSQYEGFGAPLVEAMALGCPVICSDTTCIPEVVGNAAIVRPLQPDAWADALDEVRRRRTELIAAGRHRAAMYTPERSGAALSAVLRAGVGGGSDSTSVGRAS